MELFYCPDIVSDIICLPEEESLHCARVLRHKSGDHINVVDGEGMMCECEIVSTDPRQVCAKVLERHAGWNSHPYRLSMAVCPTKNTDRYEWFVEKATEIGVDVIAPVIGEHSERRVFKTTRIDKIVVSAAKQSLKAAFPSVNEPVDVKELIRSASGLRLIACCFEDADHPRKSVMQALEEFCGGVAGQRVVPLVTILIGPEGDFSPAELKLALDNGFVPVHLGLSRLRTETAAVVAVAQVYSYFTV